MTGLDYLISGASAQLLARMPRPQAQQQQVPGMYQEASATNVQPQAGFNNPPVQGMDFQQQLAQLLAQNLGAG